MVESLLKQVQEAIRREWWVIVLVLAVGAGAGFILTSGEDVYTGVGTIVVDTAAVSRYRGMPVVDDVVKEASTTDVRELVAESLGTDASDVATSLRASASGNPLTRIRVSYSSSYEEVASEGAAAGVQALLAFTKASVQSEIDIREQQVAACEAALSELGSSDEDSYERWEVETKLLDYQNTLAGLRGVYTFDGEVAVSVAHGVDTQRNSALGGAVLGLALGVLLAGARETGVRIRESSRRR